MLSIAFISLLSFSAWMMDPQRGFYVAPRMGNFEIPVSNMQVVNREGQQKKLGPQQYQQSANKEQQGSKQEHMSKTNDIKASTIKLKNNREKRDEFVMKRGNPPPQLEKFCPKCPLNAACYTNASEFKNQTTDVKFITRKLAGI